MTKQRTDPDKPADLSTPLAAVLAKSQDVQDHVQACADEIGSTTNVIRQTLADGATKMAVEVALDSSERMEAEVQKCAEDLQGVNTTLGRSVQDLEHTELALAKSRSALARTELELQHARREEQAARHRALHDELTGLPNRAHFDTRLEQAIASAKRYQLTLAIMFLDIDKFKQINDVNGHAVGDGVLREVASRLGRSCRGEDAVCRNGGDEFLCCVMNPKSDEDIHLIAQKIQATLCEPITLGGLVVNVSVSIGISVYPKNGIKGETLIEEADAAMYSAKREPITGWRLSETAQLLDEMSFCTDVVGDIRVSNRSSM